MTLDDVPAVMAVITAAHDDAERRAGREPDVSSDQQQERFRKGMERFVRRDPDGAWVAVDGDRVVAMAEAIRRGSFWGLAMLFVDPVWQNHGLGRRLLDATLIYADGADVRMILTSFDPRALRRYALAGLAIHPTVEADGRVDRATLPAGLPGRAGNAADLDLVAEVDANLRGSRAEDVEFLLNTGLRMEVIDAGAGRGFAIHDGKRLLLLGATDEIIASQLVWRFFAESGDNVQIWGLTAAQDWAVRVALAAKVKIVCSGPLFISGLDQPPGPWVPSGWYF